jgi:hypothetical protein
MTGLIELTLTITISENEKLPVKKYTIGTPG